MLPGTTFLALAAQGTEQQAEAPETDARPSVQATRISNSAEIQVNGRLDDPAWAKATPIKDFRQEDPVEGGMPSERTEVFVLYDSENLYIGAELYDSDPEGIIGWTWERNAGLGSDDQFRLILDTFGDGRTGFLFETNPVAAMRDGVLVPNSRPNRS